MTNKGGAIAVNRKAYFDYDIQQTIEAGIVLLGTEIKAIREGRANINEAFAKKESGEIWLFNAHISQYSAGGINAHNQTRPRKLLLHKNEIDDLSKQVDTKGLTLIALKLYIKNHKAKIQIGLARGRKKQDKRRAIIDREREREAQRAMRSHRK